VSSPNPSSPDGWIACEVLGRGSVTTTFIVEHDAKRAVCKRLLPRTVRDETARASLAREGKILQHLDGRGAPRWIAEGDDAEGPWLLLEFLAMGSLGARLRETAGPLEPSFVARAAESAFGALDLVHSTHVVHGDISPDNVLVARDGSAAALVDFGLASAPDLPRAHAAGGAFRGTLVYAAPEVARGEPFDAAADRFALAASLAHAALGFPPRDGPEAAMLVRAGEVPLDDYAARARAVLSGATGERVVRHLAFDARVR
jgi:eukaryotic-like serine/threonine-protein kinase